MVSKSQKKAIIKLLIKLATLIACVYGGMCIPGCAQLEDCVLDCALDDPIISLDGPGVWQPTRDPADPTLIVPDSDSGF